MTVTGVAYLPAGRPASHTLVVEDRSVVETNSRNTHRSRSPKSTREGGDFKKRSREGRFGPEMPMDRAGRMQMTEKITIEEVRHVAELARLELDDTEVERMTRQLNSILGYIEKLNQVDTSQVEPTTHAIQIQNVFRSDDVRPSLERQAGLANAPRTDGVSFVVPKVI